MADKPTAFINARLLGPASGYDQPGDVLVENGLIADIGPNIFQDSPPSGCEVIDLKGACLAPGIVDMRMMIGEPGFEHKETIQTACDAAAAGGVTAMACLPNTNPLIDNVAGVEFVARRARMQKRTKIFPYGSVTQNLNGSELAEMGLLQDAGAVGFTDGLQAVSDSKVMSRALSYAKIMDALILQQPADVRLCEGGDMSAGEICTNLGLKGIPRQAEVMMLERDLRLVEMTGGRYHASLISTREAIEAIRKAKDDGLNVTCDTAPQYFALTEVDVGDYRTFAKTFPPLREEMDRRAVAEAVADGTIDVIVSDHNPQDQDSKRVPFAQAEFGMVGLETLLPLSLELFHKDHCSLLDVLYRLSVKPAEILGLPMGRLAKEKPADFIIFDPDRTWKINPEEFNSKSKNSPYEGRPVSGKLLRTVVDGKTIFRAD